MAYVNVIEWSPEHVAEWLRGLEYSLLPYVQFFLNNGIDGHHLLNLTANDLEDLHIFKIGHQQLILEAVELLRQLHYSLNSETLQSLAVKLSCKARSLHNDLKLNGPHDHSENTQQERVSTNVLSSVSEVLTSVKALVSWLDRAPFHKDPVCMKLKKTILKLSIELALTTQRDQFAERPHMLIKKNSVHIAELCDQFVQNSMDSLILQPASLDIAMIKKKPEEELGIHIKSTYSGVHIIGGIKDQSPTKSCNKVEKGDEIVQVNYQTVIGWQQKKLVTTMTEHSTELQLTLKKRPRHLNLLGEVIILRPYRIPSKKANKKIYNWPDDNQLSVLETNMNDNECDRSDYQDDDSAFLPDSSNQLHLSKELPAQYRLIESCSTTAIQRRATVSGASPISLKSPISIEDLVNGIFSTKLTDHYGRSVSHDSSCKKLPHETRTLLNCNQDERLLCREDVAKNVFEKCSTNRSLKNNSNFQNSVFVKKTDKSKTLSEDANQGEELSMTENMKVAKSNNPTDFQKFVLNSSSNFSECQNKQDNIPEKSSTTLYSWENNVTEFFGRRPSAYDISNEIAGSKEDNIDPVYLKKASKFESSPVNKGKNLLKHGDEMTSYQVVIVGGVPQKCITAAKEEKERKTFEHFLNTQEIKRRISSQFRNRLISCKDLGHGDCEGWLYRQKKRKGFFPNVHCWTKRWIVLKEYFLYCYKDKNDTKAECLIWLPGSTVSPVKDYNPKKFAFRIYQQRTNFYFASDSQKDLTNWMNKIGLAAIAYDAEREYNNSFFNADSGLGLSNNFYSETDDSESGSPVTTRHENHSYAAEAKVNSYQPTSIEAVWNKSSSFPANKKFLLSSENYQVKRTYDIPQLKESKKEFGENFQNQVKSVASTAKAPLSQFPIEINYKCFSKNISNIDSSPLKKPIIHLKEPLNYSMTNSGKKNSFDESLHNDTYSKITYNINSSEWDSIGEEYDATTASLGRPQKPLVKEITPGFVARMAVSYTNLSKNPSITSKSNKKYELTKTTPSPGYVAKMSDSFDHLASSKYNSDNIVKGQQKDTSNAKREKCENNSYKCKRSSSEIHVTKSVLNTRQYLSSSGVEAPNIHSKAFPPDNKAVPTQSEKYISLLDREYNKVFDGKKVSQHQLKSSTNQKLLSSAKKETKVFPFDSHIKNSLLSGDNQSIENKHYNTNESESFSRTTNKEIVGKGFSLPINGNMNNRFCTKYANFNQFNKVSSDVAVKNTEFTAEGSVSIKDSDTNLRSLEDKEVTLQLENSNSNCEMNSLYSSDVTSSDIDSPKMSFKFFSSPKFMKKLTSPKLDKKNIFKSKKQAKEQKKSEQKDIKLCQNEKKFFGSPILARTFFGSPKIEKKVMTVSSSVQTDIALITSFNPKINEAFQEQNCNQQGLNLKPSHIIMSNTECCDEVTLSNSSSCSSLTSYTSSLQSPFINSVYYVEAKIKPQITVSLPLVPDETSESRTTPLEASRTPLKPMMGVTMLAKKRLPSISGESTASISSSKNSQDLPCRKTPQILSEFSMDINGEDEDDNEVKMYCEANSSETSSVPNFDEIDVSNASS